MSPNILGWYDFGWRYYNPVYGRWFNVDPALQLANPYLYCANSPMMFVDPDGEFIQLIAIAIFAGVMNGLMNADRIDNFGQAAGYFGVGAAASAAGGVAGTAMAGAVGTIGFTGGALTGAAAGFSGGLISGAGNAWMGGADFGTGLASGFKSGAISGLAGGAIGGVAGGIKSAVHHGNFFSGKGATFDSAGGPAAGSKITIGEGMEYSNEYAQNFSDEHYSWLTERGNNLYADGTLPNSSYKIDGDAVVRWDGKTVRGSTVYQGTGRGSDVYLYKAAFVSKEQLYLTMGHEYLHVGYFANGLGNVKSQHAAIHQWEGQQARAWGLDYSEYEMKFDKVRSGYNSAYHYKKQGFYILGIRPWY